LNSVSWRRKKLSQIYNTNSNVQTEHKRHNYILNRIKQKITENNAIWAQADKGRTSVVVYKQDYNQKIENFITENEIHPTPKKSNKRGLQNNKGHTPKKATLYSPRDK
jgi:hypothetical protein